MKRRLKKQQTKAESGLVSTEKKESSNTQSVKTQSGEGLSGTLPRRKTCNNTKYALFIKVYVTGETALIGGDEAWRDMLEEYADMLHIGKAKEGFKLWMKILYCDWQLTVVESCANTLRDFFIQSCADALVEAGFTWVQNIEDDAAYQKQIDIVMNETSSVIVRLNQYKTQYDKLFPPQVGERPKRTELDFDKELAVLAKHGYRINKRKQTVTEYCGAVNAFSDEVKKNKHGQQV